MSREEISETIKRRLYAESMGRCMNPNCQCELFRPNGDVIEKAHIDPYCKTADNSFENLVILCPTCHTDFDKNAAFSPEEVLSWKKNREQEIERILGRKFNSFDELKNEVVPILMDNKGIFEQYYLNNNIKLWRVFEPTILINNRKLKTLLINNRDLFQNHPEKEYSNVEYVNIFLRHIDEFEATRGSDEKERQVLFPEVINSIFGISPVKDYLMPSTESLEALISALNDKGIYGGIKLEYSSPYIKLYDNGSVRKVFIDDTPQLRQLYYDYNCFRKCKVRLDSLTFAMRYIHSRGLSYSYVYDNNLREIIIKGIKIIFVYEYCLSK